MAIRTVRMYGDPALRQKARLVESFDPPLAQLVGDMFETMRASKGVGLAAPQIGQSIRVLVAELEPNKQEGEKGFKVALCNPEIVKASTEMDPEYEGCLSIPGWIGEVPRHVAVTVKGQSPEGKEVRIRAEGYYARVLQHELDHLNGVLFTDRIVDIKTLHRLDPDTSPEEEQLLEV